MRIVISGGHVLHGTHWDSVDVAVDTAAGESRIEVGDSREAGLGLVIDAQGLLVLPGIVDVHGDAFERQIEPRPQVRFPLDMALVDTDRQIAASGITTAYHGVTWSWEPGLRGRDMALAIVTAIAELAPRLAADTRVHLRHETFNLDAEADIIALLASGRIGCLAFNDHMSGTIKERHRPDKMAKMVQRSGLSEEAFNALVDRMWSRREDVPASIVRLAAAATAHRVEIFSHDDASPAQRAWFRELGARVSEFPINEETAAAATAAGEPTVFGAPNVVRGGSHTGCPSAADMVAKGLCGALASDYYYPALLQAPFRLAADGCAELAEAWRLVSAAPAAMMGLHDRGEIVAGKRADLVLVDASGPQAAAVATIANGRLCHLSDGGRLRRG
jgi:alpha-D-ribose 1-methylphosphonate 5-triphosphate diphosphatase